MQERVGKKAQRMVRKQILITPEQNRLLKARAAATSVAEAEIVRQGIELALDLPADQKADWRETFNQFMQGEPVDEAFAKRIHENKRFQRQAWRQRLERNRRRMDGE